MCVCSYSVKDPECQTYRNDYRKFFCMSQVYSTSQRPWIICLCQVQDIQRTLTNERSIHIHLLLWWKARAIPCLFIELSQCANVTAGEMGAVGFSFASLGSNGRINTLCKHVGWREKVKFMLSHVYTSSRGSCRVVVRKIMREDKWKCITTVLYDVMALCSYILQTVDTFMEFICN